MSNSSSLRIGDIVEIASGYNLECVRHRFFALRSFRVTSQTRFMVTHLCAEEDRLMRVMRVMPVNTVDCSMATLGIRAVEFNTERFRYIPFRKSI